MVEYLLHAYPLLTVELQDRTDEAFGLLGDGGTKLVLAVLNLCGNFLEGASPEGSHPMEKLVQENSQAPDVYFVVVLPLENHLWGHILVCSTER